MREFYPRSEDYCAQHNHVYVGSPLLALLVEWHLGLDPVNQLKDDLLCALPGNYMVIPKV